jgi:hypothetical protein
MPLHNYQGKRDINMVVKISQLEIYTSIITAPPITRSINPAAILNTSSRTICLRIPLNKIDSTGNKGKYNYKLYN